MNALLQQRVLRIDLKWRLLFVALIELAYVIASRMLASSGASLTQVEIGRTPLRIVAAGLFWIVMRDVISARVPVPEQTWSAWLFGITLLALATPILIGGYNLPAYESTVLAVTSIPVAVAEELFFRGIVQNIAVKRWGVFEGLAVTLALFLTYHIGVIRGDVFGYAQVITMGLVVGLIYLKTGSIFTVIVIHAVYDALDSMPRLFVSPDRIWGLAFLVPAVLLAMLWSRRKTSSP